MNTHWILFVILGNSSIIFGLSTTIEFDELNPFGRLVYAQSGTSNASSLPPVELESVEPNGTEDANTTTISEENSTGYLQYEDPDIGYKTDYPSDWEVADADLTNNAVVAFSPPNNDVEFDVKVINRPNSMSLKTLGNTFKKDEDLHLSSFYRNSTTLLAGQPAIRLSGTLIVTPNVFQSMTGQESSTNKILSMITLGKDRKSFLQVVYYADNSNFYDYLPQVEHMLKSFQFQNTKPIIQEED